MTIQVETVNKDRKRSRWHTTKNWLTVIAEGMDYNPQEYANSMVRHLLQKVEQLERRVNEIEGHKTAEAE
jgi:hypothetical protein